MFYLNDCMFLNTVGFSSYLLLYTFIVGEVLICKLWLLLNVVFKAVRHHISYPLLLIYLVIVNNNIPSKCKILYTIQHLNSAVMMWMVYIYIWHPNQVMTWLVEITKLNTIDWLILQGLISMNKDNYNDKHVYKIFKSVCKTVKLLLQSIRSL